MSVPVNMHFISLNMSRSSLTNLAILWHTYSHMLAPVHVTNGKEPTDHKTLEFRLKRHTDSFLYVKPQYCNVL